MDGRIDLITLVSVVLIALIAIWKLASVLGRRTDADDARVDRKLRVRAERERAEATQGKVVTLPRRDRDDAASLPPSGAPSAAQSLTAQAQARVKTITADPAVERGLLSVLQADPSFDPDHFLSGAKQAYEMIVTAFAEGNRKLLKDLLSREVFDGFAAAIVDREKRGEVIDQSFVGIGKADIIEADLKGGTANITVRFESQLISATRDKAGEVIAGDAQKITDVTDIWSFARDLSSRSPNWRLVATQSAA